MPVFLTASARRLAAVVTWSCLTQCQTKSGSNGSLNSVASKSRLQEGLWILKGREVIRTIQVPFVQTFLAPAIAETYCGCGEDAEGLKLLEEAASTLTETSMGQGVSEIYRLRGNILAASGRIT